MRYLLLQAVSAVAIVLTTTSAAFPSLAWDTRDTDLRADINDEEAVAKFTFTNTGDRPVTIRRVSSSCGCTATKADGEVYEPGESGTIAATFTFGNRTGMEVKTIRVVTDDPDQAEHHLTMRVHIPAGLEIEPRFVYWNAGDAQEPKTIEVTAADHSIELQDVEIDSEAFTAEIETLEESRRYRVTVTPTTDAAPTAADGATTRLTFITDTTRTHTCTNACGTSRRSHLNGRRSRT